MSISSPIQYRLDSLWTAPVKGVLVELDNGPVDRKTVDIVRGCNRVGVEDKADASLFRVCSELGNLREKSANPRYNIGGGGFTGLETKGDNLLRTVDALPLQ